MRESGIYHTLGTVRFFIPHPLPPINPPFSLTPEIMAMYGEALFALGKLNEVSSKIPSHERFVKAYVIKEALLTSSIEGIETTLLDVFTQPISEAKPTKNTQLVLNYSNALEAALTLLRAHNLPITSRVLLAAHRELMAGEANPGELRQQTVRVGAFIPPPAPEIPKLMGELEKFINVPSEIPALIAAGLAHVQFETIHPFLDGNGRIGRLLIVLMLLQNKLLNEPVLYPSYYFKKHHAEYYHRLNQVNTSGDFEGWILFYLKAIKESAHDAHWRALEIQALEKHFKTLFATHPAFSKTKETATRTLDFLFTHPVTTAGLLSKTLRKAYNTAQSMLKQFCNFGIVEPINDNKRNKCYKYAPYLALLEQEQP